MNSTSPVLTKAEVPNENVIALDQPEYDPIITLKVMYTDNSVATFTRFTFTDSERRAIASGADLIIGQPHHSNMMPISLQLAWPNAYPQEF